MSNLAHLLYLLGGFSGALLFLTVVWEIFSRLSKEAPEPAAQEEAVADEWDPFKHLSDINRSVLSASEGRAATAAGQPQPAGYFVPPSQTPPVPNVPAGRPENRENPPPRPEHPEDPWKALMRDQQKANPKLPREIAMESEEEEGKT